MSATTARRLRNVTEGVWDRYLYFNYLTGCGSVKRNDPKTAQIALIFAILPADHTMYDVYRRVTDKGEIR